MSARAAVTIDRPRDELMGLWASSEHRPSYVEETGEVVRSDGAPWGKQARREFPQRPAQPLSDSELAKGADA